MNNFAGLIGLQKSYQGKKQKKLKACIKCGALMKSWRRTYCIPCNDERRIELKRKTTIAFTNDV